MEIITLILRWIGLVEELHTNLHIREDDHYYWHFPPFFLTRISTPSNWKKCSKGYIATIFITGYYYWRINFFFENQPTSGWDTATFFLKINAPGITHKIKVVVNVWNIQNSEKILKIDDILLRKLSFLTKSPVLFCSIIFINILSQFFWSSGQDSELQIQGSWVQSPQGKNFFWKIFFVCFLYKNKYILRSNT